jgi:hypothetical protein
MLRVVSRRGDFATICCDNCGLEYDEMWTFQNDTIREWAQGIREAHICELDPEDEFDPDNDLENINFELERLDRRMNEKDRKDSFWYEIKRGER